MSHEEYTKQEAILNELAHLAFNSFRDSFPGLSDPFLNVNNWETLDDKFKKAFKAAIMNVHRRIVDFGYYNEDLDIELK